MPISDAEAQVMQVLWERHPRSADDVVTTLASSTDWAEPTVKTLLNRLLNKGAISASKEGRRYRYSPVLQRADWVNTESSGLLDRLFDGRIAPLVAHFSAHRKLTAEDVSQLRELLAEIDDERR